MKSNLRNEIKSYIVRQGMTMQEVVCSGARSLANRARSVSNITPA